MSTADLWSEMDNGARHLRPTHLTQLGVTIDDVAAAGGLAAAWIMPLSNGLYEPGGGLAAALLPVCDFELTDICAFASDNPHKWWLRRGDASFLGTADDLWLNEPLRIHRTPLGWLQAGADGVCVLDWATAAPKLRAVAVLIAEDIEHHQDILSRLQAPLLIPEIRILESSIERLVQ